MFDIGQFNNMFAIKNIHSVNDWKDLIYQSHLVLKYNRFNWQFKHFLQGMRNNWLSWKRLRKCRKLSSMIYPDNIQAWLYFSKTC